ncbi:polyribonucleotide nucleotidyltransferase [Candidatus Nanoperiomorbus periodonticus]|uniref:polyribonucleotide nucleotidyltransferase n=1 Tax=Candidatus Nanoperiomorbus periodonticus TaxID=2171989 RepID=UPI00101C2D6B|nr:polyribonucleotide nucleotidyltransferase [Candidatus Nanoperiomorbus periodonticus]RYC75656.1 Polyribonucleotide nucleotidyltransferase [Candidatus Nanoperiomorbus periodonticus]
MTKVIQTGKDIIWVSTDWLGRELSMEVNKVGFRTTASVIVRYGDTVVLGIADSGEVNPNLDYFPLSIDYEEKYYASGKISSSRFIKREGRPSDEAILIGRLIDRPIRPLFPKGYRNECQVVTTVLSMDPAFRPDAVAMLAASAALMLTGVPFDGPIAGLRIGLDEQDNFRAFMSRSELEQSRLDLFVAGKTDKVMMVEAGANEVSEDTLADAFAWALEQIKPALDLQLELRDLVQPEAQSYQLVIPDEQIAEQVESYLSDKLPDDLRVTYAERNPRIAEIKQAMLEHFQADYDEATWPERQADYLDAFDKVMHQNVRQGIIERGVRPDGRQLDEIRPLSSEVHLLPRTHGSSLFTRGLTQALNIVTLAPLSYAQLVDTMEVTDGERRYMHHYNAPGYTVGEIKRLGAPGRREVGHGYLAERALLPMLPDKEDFPYAIRSVTEIMSQNGSTSMAATCSSCLALMDAGVPLKRPVSGVAMGLIVDGDRHFVLTDLADQEDFAGDMDFKCTGTTEGITALQMDMKVHGLPVDILRDALKQAKQGRAKILTHMLRTIAEPRAELSPYAPRIEKLLVNPDKIGSIIGKGGETINKITSETGVEIDIDESGLVTFASTDGEKMQRAIDWVKGLVEEPEVGKVYTGTVVGLKDFGAFINILPGVDGMLHVSKIAERRISSPDEVLKVGQKVRVKLTLIDDKGRLSLTMLGIKQDI